MNQDKIICIEGNIGAGKTTLAQLLAREMNLAFVQEKFLENPYLKDFYKKPNKYSLRLEMYFLVQRYRQLQSVIPNTKNKVVTDFYPAKSLIFGQHTLDKTDFGLLEEMADALNLKQFQPELLVYLHRPAEEVKELIDKRNRKFEKEISLDYLNRVHDAYVNYFSSMKIKTLWLDCSGLDFAKKPEHFEAIKTIMNRKKPASSIKPISVIDEIVKG